MSTKLEMTPSELLEHVRVKSSRKIILQSLFENGGKIKHLWYGNDKSDVYVVIEYKGAQIPIRFYDRMCFLPFNSPLTTSVTVDKHITYEMMRVYGLPAPWTIVYDNTLQLEKIIEQHSTVVVKPASRSHADGVTTGITSAEKLKDAVKYARGFDKKVLLQSQISGDDHRLLFVNYKLAAALRRHRPFIIGDGKLTVKQLIEAENARRRVKAEEDSKLSPLARWRADICSVISENEVSRRHGKQFLDTIPAANKKVVLLNISNIMVGGIPEDVTSRVHPSVIEACSDFLRAIRLEYGGVDLMSQDISAPITAGKTFAIEVNSSPGLLPHARPHIGKPQDVGKIVAEALALCFRK